MLLAPDENTLKGTCESGALLALARRTLGHPVAGGQGPACSPGPGAGVGERASRSLDYKRSGPREQDPFHAVRKNDALNWRRLQPGEPPGS